MTDAVEAAGEAEEAAAPSPQLPDTDGDEEGMDEAERARLMALYASSFRNIAADVMET